MQPFASSTWRVIDAGRSEPSMPTAPSSLTMTAIRPCPGLRAARRQLSSVVLPLPRKPVRRKAGTMVR
jgi:hypothetical protein